MPPERPPFRRLLARALRRRCPACGRGAVFAGLLRLERACPACGWILEREPGAVTGSMYVVSVLSQLFAAAAFLLVWLATDWSHWTKVAVAAPLIALFSLWALSFSRILWAAVEFYTDVAAGEAQQDRYAERAYGEKSRRGEAEDQPG